ncbi:MAG: hypothetical protein Fur0010_23580 [Bdellovibrio sp.]
MPVARWFSAVLFCALILSAPLFAKEAKLQFRIKENKCHSPCTVTAKLKLKHHKMHKDLLGFQIDWNDGSPIEVITTESAQHT